MENKITIREAVLEQDIAAFWEQLHIYHKRDIFPGPIRRIWNISLAKRTMTKSCNASEGRRIAAFSCFFSGMRRRSASQCP